MPRHYGPRCHYRPRSRYAPRVAQDVIDQIKADHAAGMRPKQLLKKYNVSSINTLNNWIYNRSRI